MTLREVYEYALIENNKLEAPSLLLDDFNYLFKKAVQQYSNKVYNRFEANQQSTDDMRVLKDSTSLEVKTCDEEHFIPNEDKEFYVTLPDNYFHLLNCVVEFQRTSKNNKTSRCSTKDSEGSLKKVPAHKLTSDAYPSILINAYLKPSPTHPYYFINNVSGEESYSELEAFVADVLDEELPEKGTGSKMQLRCGDTSKWEPTKVYIDYIKTPKNITLKEEQLDLVDGCDISDVLEFPDYVCFEIINELAKLMLENSSDPRLQTHIPINQTIGNVQKDVK